MANFNGDVNAGRDVNVFEQHQVYKYYDQFTPEELRTERPMRQGQLYRYRKQRFAQTPKWLMLFVIGLLIGAGFLYYVYSQKLSGSGFSVAWQFVGTISHNTHPMALPAAFAVYMMLLIVIPLNRIFDLLFGEDDIIREHKAALKRIHILLGVRG